MYAVSNPTSPGGPNSRKVRKSVAAVFESTPEKSSCPITEPNGWRRKEGDGDGDVDDGEGEDDEEVDDEEDEEEEDL